MAQARQDEESIRANLFGTAAEDRSAAGGISTATITES
jgi:hypothetical protein